MNRARFVDELGACQIVNVAAREQPDSRATGLGGCSVLGCYIAFREVCPSVEWLAIVHSRPSIATDSRANEPRDRVDELYVGSLFRVHCGTRYAIAHVRARTKAARWLAIDSTWSPRGTSGAHCSACGHVASDRARYSVYR